MMGYQCLGRLRYVACFIAVIVLLTPAVSEPVETDSPERVVYVRSGTFDFREESMEGKVEVIKSSHVTEIGECNPAGDSPSVMMEKTTKGKFQLRTCQSATDNLPQLDFVSSENETGSKSQTQEVLDNRNCC